MSLKNKFGKRIKMEVEIVSRLYSLGLLPKILSPTYRVNSIADRVRFILFTRSRQEFTSLEISDWTRSIMCRPSNCNKLKSQVSQILRCFARKGIIELIQKGAGPKPHSYVVSQCRLTLQ